MLGFTSSREPVRGEVAREIRAQLQRIATKSFHKHDRKRMMMQKSSASYKRMFCTIYPHLEIGKY